MNPPPSATRTNQEAPERDARAEFDEAFDAFFASVRRARARAAKRGDTGGLSLAQFQLLAAFFDREEYVVGELADAAGVAAPTATRMLDGLERDGIVERAQSAQDRRRVTVRLTGEGQKLLQRKRRKVAAARRKMFDSLTEDERAESARLLGRLADLMEQL